MIAWFESVGIGTYYLRLYALYGAGLLAAVTLAWTLRRRLPGWARATLWIGITLAIVRIVAFGNPVALRAWQRLVSPETIGARQWDTLDIEIRKYARRIDQPEIANLAVGSSQVGAIFSHWIGEEPLEVFSLSGMKTLDYELYRDEIAARRPARVILFLSAFDLTAAPELSSWPLAPPHPTRMADVVARVRASVPDEVASGPSHEYIGSQLFPEYRYRFLFSGLLRQWTARATGRVAGLPWTATLHAATAPEAVAPPLPPPTEAELERLRQFDGYHLPEWLDYNVRFLRSFIEFCRDRGIDVVIVEGQISPLAETAKFAHLETLVRARFDELLLLFPNLRVVPVTDTYRFAREEYSDLTHVHPEAARRYTPVLSALLGRATVPMTAACDVTFTQGWHLREGSDADWMRWSTGTGRLRLRTRIAGAHTLRADVLSLARPNGIDIRLEGERAARWSITDTAWTFHEMPPVRLDLAVDRAATLQIVGDAPPSTSGTDQRMLGVAVRSLTLTAPDGTTCAVNQR